VIPFALYGALPYTGRMIRKAFSLWVAAVVGLVVPVSAGPNLLGLELSAQVRQQGSNQWVAVAARNVGEASVFGLVGEARIDGTKLCGDSLEALACGDRASLRIPLDGVGRSRGVRAVPIEVHYTDERGYPFSDIAVAQWLTDFPPEGVMPIEVAFVPAASGSDAQGQCRLTSHLAEAVTVELALHVPEKACVEPQSIQVVVPPGASVEVPLRVSGKRGAGGHHVTIIGLATVRTATHRWDAVAVDAVRLPAQRWLSPRVRRGCWWLALLSTILAYVCNWSQRRWRRPLPLNALIDAGVLIVITLFIAGHVPPQLLLTNTVPTGGDIPAHSYLASHLRDSLLQQGRVVAWADGWWGGFPMFQYYFPLPYLAMALLSLLIPFNIAFKLVAVSGLYALPLCAYGAARIGRLKHPLPALAAIATVPLLLDTTHTMWGVNIFSTLAGMIANSLSFCGMLLFIASAYRDAADGRFRLRTPLLFVLVLSSHFFTSLMAVLVVLPAPLIAPRGERRRALGVLARSGLLGALLMAWWLVPLIAKRPYSIDYGTNWPVTFAELTSPMLGVVAAFAVVGLVLRYRRRDRNAWGLVAMLVIAGLLFFFGFKLSPVFVNIRLWPFLLYALWALGAHGAGLVLDALRLRGAGLRAPGLFVLPLLFVILALHWSSMDIVRVGWAAWNFGGLESKPHYELFDRLLAPLDGTPGRLANDLHPANVSLGSSRVFESVPHLIDKPILEGGIVNSALGSLAAYYIQSESSQHHAGAPPMVQCASFNMAHATAHLRWMNVTHFVAKWEGTKEAMRQAPVWRSRDHYRGWELFELTSHDGRTVKVLPAPPVAVRAGERWKEAGLEWLYTPSAFATPVAILGEHEPADPFAQVWSYEDFVAEMAAQRAASAELPAALPLPRSVLSESVEEGLIRFRTDAIGAPHLIKMSWFPNWQVTGASHIYRIAPCFMLVYPEQEMVELRYGRSAVDWLGMALSWLGLALLGLILVRRRSTPCAISEPDC
jgi:hypothetical protein